MTLITHLHNSLLATTLLALLSPATAWAEGGVRLLECTIAQACDAAGNCEAGSEQFTFRMDPLALDASGAGEYRISYAEVETDMQAFSEAGPFFWINDHERHTLLASSESKFLWHSLVMDTQPVASIRFLSCALRQ